MLRPSAATDHAHRVLHSLDDAQALRRIDPYVSKSWSRCLKQYGIEPGLSRDTAVLEARELRQRQQRFGNLLRIAQAEMENLYEQIAGSGYAVILSDPGGTIISSISDSALTREFRSSGLWLGALWDERHEGTNGIGTCIVERRPVIVHRDEHYMGYNIALSCSGAPIVDPRGEILAVLDASSVNSSDTKVIQRHTMALVNMSANLVSKCHFLSEFPQAWVLRFHSRAEFVGLLHEALLAVNEDGRILAANDSAVTQLGYDSRQALVGQPIQSVFQFDFAMLAQRGARDPNGLWPVRNAVHGRRFFAMVRAPLQTMQRPPVIATRPLPGATGASSDAATAPAVVCGDPIVRRHLQCARQLFERQVPILLEGATGTGKEVFARILHQSSAWAGQPFVAVNCAAIPETLIESELFGYSRGAFTDASREGRRGKIQQASGGTLFLDEIGDMPLALQTRLLRVLEAREVVPLGAEKPISVELHLISASHRDLRRMIEEGRFREDLFYRLNGMTLKLPPLKDRADKAELIDRLLVEEASPGPPVRLGAEARAVLMRYSWPGNIRQLRNVLRSAAALCSDGVIERRGLPPELLGELDDGAGSAEISMRPPGASSHPLQEAERATLRLELERRRWNVTSTAEALGMSRNTLYRKMKRHGIHSP